MQDGALAVREVLTVEKQVRRVMACVHCAPVRVDEGFGGWERSGHGGIQRLEDGARGART